MYGAQDATHVCQMCVKYIQVRLWYVEILYHSSFFAFSFVWSCSSNVFAVYYNIKYY